MGLRGYVDKVGVERDVEIRLLKVVSDKVD